VRPLTPMGEPSGVFEPAKQSYARFCESVRSPMRVSFGKMFNAKGGELRHAEGISTVSTWLHVEPETRYSSRNVAAATSASVVEPSPTRRTTSELPSTKAAAGTGAISSAAAAAAAAKARSVGRGAARRGAAARRCRRAHRAHAGTSAI
jgi:hypothetical protein